MGGFRTTVGLELVPTVTLDGKPTAPRKTFHLLKIDNRSADRLPSGNISRGIPDVIIDRVRPRGPGGDGWASSPGPGASFNGLYEY